MKEGIVTKAITQKALDLFTTFTNLMIAAKAFQAETLLEQKLLPFWHSQLAEHGTSIQKMCI